MQTLRNGLQLTDRFALFIAVVNRPGQRDSLVRELVASVPELNCCVVRLTESTVDPLDDVLRQAGDPPVGPVMVVDFDAALPSAEQYHSSLQALNLRRPAWSRHIPHPVIFWVPEYVLTLLGREAPDFLDWRSATIFFPDATDRDLMHLRTEAWEGGINTNFTRPQRLARMEELETRLKLYESEDRNARILGVCGEWSIELGLHHQFLGEGSKAIDCFNNALRIFRLIGDRKGECRALVLLSIVHLDRGNIGEGIAYFEQLLAIARDINDRKVECEALALLGLVSEKLGESDKAINFIRRSLDIACNIGDRKLESWVLDSMGRVLILIGTYREGIDTLVRSLSLSQQIRDVGGEIASLDALGDAMVIVGNYHGAIHYFNRSLILSQEIGDRLGEGTSLGKLGKTWVVFGDPRRAIGFFEQHITVAREIGDRRGEADSSYDLAWALREIGEAERSIHEAEQALNLYSAIESPQAARVRATLDAWREEISPRKKT